MDAAGFFNQAFTSLLRPKSTRSGIKPFDVFERQATKPLALVEIPRLVSSIGSSMNSNRRTFFMIVAAGCSGLVTSAHGQTKADEKDPQSVALGYVADATKTDTKKYPKYAAGQVCTNCSLYQGKASDAWGGCPLFAGKQVAGKGWCSAWVKKG